MTYLAITINRLNLKCQINPELSAIFLNYEETCDNRIEQGDVGSERFFSGLVGAQSFDSIHRSTNYLYEYGSREFFWQRDR